jgi:hypothetical protein
VLSLPTEFVHPTGSAAPPALLLVVPLERQQLPFLVAPDAQARAHGVEALARAMDELEHFGQVVHRNEVCLP